ncbi:insulin-induced protein-domain-containing protein [Delphinella strobiligena]|nr:insulin-induced protein-domain-containing protein [Delphinella strobiligena]
MSSEGPPLLRPRPRRPFEIGPLSSTTTSSQPSPEPLPTSPADETSAPPSRSRSILNLTSSTLAGVFGYGNGDEAATPWGTGAETPIDGLRQELGSLLDGKSVDDALMMRSRERRGSMLNQSTRRSRSVKKPTRRKGIKNYWLPVLAKTLALGVVGASYGAIISHLHNRQKLAPVAVDGIKHESPYYLAFWAVVGVTLGWMMPYVDGIWNDEDEEEDAVKAEYRTSQTVKSAQGGDSGRGGWAPVWYDLVRTIGAFCGIAFAIRRIPWHSTLQLSLTLALSNPTLWYLLDRSAPGFILSTTVALSGTALLLGISPDLVPSPPSTLHVVNGTLAKSQLDPTLLAGVWSYESVGVATWIASVLFVSCICFGNIGRRL